MKRLLMTGTFAAVGAAIIGTAVPMTGFAANVTWTGGANDGGNVLTGDNWGGTAPGAADAAIIGDAPEAKLTSGTVEWKNLYIGNANGKTGYLSVEGGELTLSGNLWVGSGKNGSTVTARGVLVQSGGSITMSGTGDFSAGVWAGTAGKFIQTGGDFSSPNADMYIGSRGRGTFDIGGTMTMGSTHGIYVGITANGLVGSGEMRLGNGGTLTTKFLMPWSGNIHSAVAFGAGTLNATAANATFVSGLTGLVFDPGSFTLNTDYNVSIANCPAMFGSSQSEMRKTGTGTLTIDKMPPVGNISIERGVVALSADSTATRAAVDAAAGNVFPSNPSDALKADNYLLHRWNFNGYGLDLVGTNHVDLVGSGLIAYTNDNEEVMLTGGTRGTSWIDCGSNIIPAELGDTPFTIEIWTTTRALAKNNKVFMLGNNTRGESNTQGMDSGIKGLILAFKGTGAPPTFNIYSSTGGNSNMSVGSSSLVLDREYHIAVTVTPKGGNAATVIVYIQDTVTGDITSLAKEVTNWTTSLIDQHNFWLGHSHWNDPDPAANYNEVRVWAAALSQAQIEANNTLGPDTLPVLSDTAMQGVAESVTIAAGATLDLGGHALTQPVVKGAGTITTGAGGSLVVSDKMVVNVGECIEASGTIDLSNAKIELADPENLAESFTFLKPTTGQTLTVTGVPTPTNLPRGWKVSVAADGTCRIVKRGFMLIVK